MNKLNRIFVLFSMALSVFSITPAIYAEENPAGEIEFYTSMNEGWAYELVDLFNTKYPEITVNIYRSGSEEVLSKINAENEGGKVIADVLMVADSVNLESLKEKDLLLSYESNENAHIDPKFIDKDNMYTGTKFQWTGIAYNTEKVKEAPSSWFDLTSEISKDEVVMPSPLYSGVAAYNLGTFTNDERFGWDFYEALSSNGIDIVQGNGGVVESVSTGENKYGMVVSHDVLAAKESGSPIDVVFPEEGVPVTTEPIAIINSTEEEELCKLFVDFVLSVQGQEFIASKGITPIRSDIDAPLGMISPKDLQEEQIIISDPVKLLAKAEDVKIKFSEIFNVE